MRTLTVLATLLCAGQAYAWQTGHLRYREWRPKLEGNLRVEGGTLPASNIDIDETLGVNDYERGYEIPLTVNLGSSGLVHLSFWRAKFEGSEPLSTNLIFDDLIYAAGTVAETEISYEVFSGNYEWPLQLSPIASLPLRTGILAGVRILRTKAKLSNSFYSVSERMNSWVPMLGAAVAIYPTPWLVFGGEFTGFRFSHRDIDTTFFDANAEVNLLPNQWLMIGTGYRFVKEVLEDSGSASGFELDTEIDGFYVTAGIRF